MTKSQITSVAVHDDDDDSGLSVEVTQLRGQVSHLKQCLAAKDEELEDLETSLHLALDSIKTFHEQQRQLFSEFVSLREKYDSLKSSMSSTLWDFIPQHVNAEFDAIPPVNEKITDSTSSILNYKFGKELGQGQFGIVYECRDTNDLAGGRVYAVKAIRKDKVSNAIDVQRINNEINTLKDLRHDNLLQLIDVIHSTEFLYIVMEQGGMDLFAFFGAKASEGKESGNSRHFDEKLAQSCIKQIVSCVEFLHRHKICHRDIKPENILIDRETHKIKVVDLGLSTKLADGNEELKDFCGSPGFFAPEMIIAESYNGLRVDIWSIGCVLLEMMMGNDWFETHWSSVYANLLSRDVFAEEIATAVDGLQSDIECANISVSADCVNVLRKMLDINPRSRITIHQLCMHPWIGLHKVPEKINQVKSVPEKSKIARRRNTVEPLEVNTDELLRTIGDVQDSVSLGPTSLSESKSSLKPSSFGRRGSLDPVFLPASDGPDVLAMTHPIPSMRDRDRTVSEGKEEAWNTKSNREGRHERDSYRSERERKESEDVELISAPVFSSTSSFPATGMVKSTSTSSFGDWHDGYASSGSKGSESPYSAAGSPMTPMTNNLMGVSVKGPSPSVPPSKDLGNGSSGAAGFKGFRPLLRVNPHLPPLSKDVCPTPTIHAAMEHINAGNKLAEKHKI
jgi:serine/threonine protein kinase